VAAGDGWFVVVHGEVFCMPSDKSAVDLVGPYSGDGCADSGPFRNAAACSVLSWLAQAISSWKSAYNQRVVAVSVPWKWDAD
jgi:hypothetical protein